MDQSKEAHFHRRKVDADWSRADELAIYQKRKDIQ